MIPQEAPILTSDVYVEIITTAILYLFLVHICVCGIYAAARRSRSARLATKLQYHVSRPA